MSATVRIERTGRTAVATLDRPPLNILDIATIDALRQGLEELAAEPEILTDLEAKSTPVHRMIKKAVSEAGELAPDAALAEAERIYLEELTRTHDMEEGLTAFLEKRTPNW